MALFPTDGGAGVSGTVDTPLKARKHRNEEWEDTIPLRSFLWEMGSTHVN